MGLPIDGLSSIVNQFIVNVLMLRVIDFVIPNEERGGISLF